MVQDCLDHHFRTEDLEVPGECEGACGKQMHPTRKLLGMSYLPDTLVVELKRYEWVMFQSVKVSPHAACF